MNSIEQNQRLNYIIDDVERMKNMIAKISNALDMMEGRLRTVRESTEGGF